MVLPKTYAMENGNGVPNTTDGNIEEEVMTDEQLFNKYAKDKEEKFSFKESARTLAKNSVTCSCSKVKQVVNSVIPITKWLPQYKIKKDLLSDLAAGLTVGIVHLPQGMAYSSLAQLPPVNGLYVSFFPVLIYALFGTTRHLSIGTFAVISLMVGEAISRHVADCPDETDALSTIASMVQNNTSLNVTPQASCMEMVAARKIEVSIALSVAVGIIHLFMFIFRLGILNVFFSSHMVSGFTCGAAFHVFTSQFAKLFGVEVERKFGPLAIVYSYIDFFKNIATTNVATFLISLCNIVFLFAGKEINRRYSAKLPFPIPWELAVVVFSTIASQFGYFETNYGVDVVGDIPRGIQTSIPNGSDIGLVFVDAIPIAIVVFSISVSLSAVFSEKHAYEVDANQDLLAYALANFFGSFFQCYPCAASLSRSLVWEQSGGRTQLTGLVSCVLLIITLLWIGPLFEQLPQAALSAVIVVNLKNMLMQFNQLKPLWIVSRIDAIIWFVTWISVVLLGVDFGLYIGIGISLFGVVLRTQLTFGDVMVAVGPEKIYRSSKRFNGVQHEDILIFKFPTPLIYANQSRFKHQLSTALGFKPNFEVARRKKAKEAAEKAQKQRAKELKKQENETFQNKAVFPTHLTPDAEPKNNLNYQIVPENTGIIIENTSSLSGSSAVERETQLFDRITYNGIRMPQYVILDMSICSFIDNDGVILLKALLKNLSLLNIRLLLARCTAEVRRCLLNGKFPAVDENAKDEPLFFISIDKAVAYTRQQSSARAQQATVPTVSASVQETPM